MAAANAMKIAFIIFTVLGLILTLISLFTPNWKVYTDRRNDVSFGLVSYDCDDGTPAMQASCYGWWNTRFAYEKWVMAFMILAAICEVITLIGAAAFHKIAPRHYYMGPIFAIISTILLLLSFALYSYNSTNYLPTAITTATIPRAQLFVDYHYGYSFWFAVAAFISMLLATILGFMAFKKHRDEYLPTHTQGTATTVTTERHIRYNK